MGMMREGTIVEMRDISESFRRFEFDPHEERVFGWSAFGCQLVA
jgi:hypothetical protein